MDKIKNFNKKKLKKKHKNILNTCIMLFMCCIVLISAKPAYVAATGVDHTTEQEIDAKPDSDDNTLDLSITSNMGSTKLESTLQILILLTVLSLAPSILIMVTSFTRLIIVFHFLRTALGTQTSPPNQVLVGLALFITLAIMSPVFTKVNNEAVKPYMSGKITQEEAFETGSKPLKEFMLKQTRDKDLQLFLDINETDKETINNYQDISFTAIIPAFIISELRTAFIIGFLLYMPFIVLDMVVASTLMSMGMMMLPPTTISMPFKILLFVMVDGWNLVIGELVKSFQ